MGGATVEPPASGETPNSQIMPPQTCWVLLDLADWVLSARERGSRSWKSMEKALPLPKAALGGCHLDQGGP